jgi:hypothetical protein
LTEPEPVSPVFCEVDPDSPVLYEVDFGVGVSPDRDTPLNNVGHNGGGRKAGQDIFDDAPTEVATKSTTETFGFKEDDSDL